LIFIDDVVEATLAAAAASVSPGRVYNIARGRTTIAVEVVAVLNDLLDTGLLGVLTGRPLEEEFQNLVDISRARAELRFSPAVDLRAGLTQCVQSFAGGLAREPRQGIERFTEA
jgi:nucleoside-diphosphate-sugar epimerase